MTDETVTPDASVSPEPTPHTDADRAALARLIAWLEDPAEPAVSRETVVDLAHLLGALAAHLTHYFAERSERIATEA